MGIVDSVAESFADVDLRGEAERLLNSLGADAYAVVSERQERAAAAGDEAGLRRLAKLKVSLDVVAGERRPPD